LQAGCAYEASQFGLIRWPAAFASLHPEPLWNEEGCS
jgi:hypothetical protein